MARVTHESLADRDHPRDDIDRGPRESFEIEEPDDEPSSDRQNLLDPSSSSSTNAAGAGRRGANSDSSLSKRWSKGYANGVGVSFGARAFTRRAVVVVVVFAIVLALATVYIATQAFGEEEEVDVLQFVDPLIGTGRGGEFGFATRDVCEQETSAGVIRRWRLMNHRTCFCGRDVAVWWVWTAVRPPVTMGTDEKQEWRKRWPMCRERNRVGSRAMARKSRDSRICTIREREE